MIEHATNSVDAHAEAALVGRLRRRLRRGDWAGNVFVVVVRVAQRRARSAGEFRLMESRPCAACWKTLARCAETGLVRGTAAWSDREGRLVCGRVRAESDRPR